ncbi:hypothetical protein [Buttiauxella gaviniae]|uniref:hypothetical protein n=1 Tax=Buttiauxella gaviniae TaxID=82990 RepID=UPI003BB775DD
MFRLMTYPLNIMVLLLISFVLSLLPYSSFYSLPTEKDFLNIVLIVVFYFFVLLFTFDKKRIYIPSTGWGGKIYKSLLILGLVGFFLEFAVFGVPLFSTGGRASAQVLPVLHVVFYSAMICTVLVSSLYNSPKIMLICLLMAVAISVLTLSRQMAMISFVIVIISTIFRYKFTLKMYVYFFIVLVAIGVFFGFLGNIRQQLAGDYKNDYIITIGGASREGASIGNYLYWLWLYVTSPMYNLFLNLNNYDQLGSICSSYGALDNCSKSYILSVLMPNTLSKYLGGEEFAIDLVVPHLNTGTGYAIAGRLYGIMGVFLQLTIQFLYYIIGYLFTPRNVRAAYVVLFSAFSIFMIFDNLYTRGEFFFCFVLIVLSGLIHGRSKNIDNT